MYEFHSFRYQKNKHSCAIKLAQPFQTHSNYSRSIILYNEAHSRSFPQQLNSTSLHFLLYSILIAEAIMALLRFSLLLTIFLSIGQTTRQTDTVESKNVSRSSVFLTFVDPVALAKGHVTNKSDTEQLNTLFIDPSHNA